MPEPKRPPSDPAEMQQLLEHARKMGAELLYALLVRNKTTYVTVSGKVYKITAEPTTPVKKKQPATPSKRGQEK